MIGNRTQGMRLLSHIFVVVYMLFRYGLTSSYSTFVLEWVELGENRIPRQREIGRALGSVGGTSAFLRDPSAWLVY